MVGIQEKKSLETKTGPTKVLACLFGAILLCLFMHVAIGTSQNLPPSEVLHQLFRGPVDLGGQESDRTNFIIWVIRMPRALDCLFVGALLGAVGSVFQALLRNPLADPYIVGVSSGSALGGAAVLVTGIGGMLGTLGMAAGGCVTGILTLLLVYRLSMRRGSVDVRILLLSGVVIGSLLSALLSLILLVEGRNEVDVLHWLMGDTSNANWSKVGMLAVTLTVGFGLLYRQSRQLNAFAIGEDTARRLGVDVRRLTKTILLVGGVMTAVAVGTVGVIAFLGLVAPHIARKLVGVDWRWSMPGALAVGALLLLASDVIAQRLFSTLTGTVGMDIPVGIVTSILGAPSLLLLLKKA